MNVAHSCSLMWIYLDFPSDTTLLSCNIFTKSFFPDFSSEKIKSIIINLLRNWSTSTQTGSVSCHNFPRRRTIGTFFNKRALGTDRAKHRNGMFTLQEALGNRQADRHWRVEFTNILTCFGERFEWCICFTAKSLLPLHKRGRIVWGCYNNFSCVDVTSRVRAGRWRGSAHAQGVGGCLQLAELLWYIWSGVMISLVYTAIVRKVMSLHLMGTLSRGESEENRDWSDVAVLSEGLKSGG